MPKLEIDVSPQYLEQLNREVYASDFHAGSAVGGLAMDVVKAIVHGKGKVKAAVPRGGFKPPPPPEAAAATIGPDGATFGGGFKVGYRVERGRGLGVDRLQADGAALEAAGAPAGPASSAEPGDGAEAATGPSGALGGPHPVEAPLVRVLRGKGDIVDGSKFDQPDVVRYRLSCGHFLIRRKGTIAPETVPCPDCKADRDEPAPAAPAENSAAGG